MWKGQGHVQFAKAITVENLKDNEKLLKGTKAKTRVNGGQDQGQWRPRPGSMEAKTRVNGGHGPVACV